MLKTFLFISLFAFICINPNLLYAQGVTTAAMNGLVQDTDGNPLPGANIIAEHMPSGTQYGASTRENGLFNLPNLRIGGPYTVTVSYIGYISAKQENINLDLGLNFRLEFTLQSEAVKIGEVVVSAEQDAVMNSSRTGAETSVTLGEVQNLPSIKRTTRDLIRLDPRSDGNYSFGGKNWLYNNISVDGSYFNNPFGLDDPAPGGQTAAEPIPYDAIDQLQVSIAPFDVKQGGFTGAGVNTVTKSGTNQWKGSLYTFGRNETFVGNEVDGNQVVANPQLSYYQSGFSVSGPIIENKLFFFLNGEIERRTDPGSNFVADRDGNVTFGESRVYADSMDLIRNRMIQVYGYDPGVYEGYDFNTDNEKILLKLNWNVNENNELVFRYNRLDANRGLGPHPFVLSFNQTGRGPNDQSLPFQNSGYVINNLLNSYVLEWNARGKNFSNRFFVSYNQFNDYRAPNSGDFPTIEIGNDGVTYTTLGEEPFSNHNILDQDVLQITNNFDFYLGNHVLTAGATFEYYKYFNSFNIFRNGLFQLPLAFGGTTYPTLQEFLRATNPDSGAVVDFLGRIETGPYKGEFIEVGQLSVYAQDEFIVSPTFNLKYGLRVDIPMYFTDPVANPFSTGLTLLDENDNPEVVDQAKMPDTQFLFSPRVGFNWDINGDRVTQLRGGTGIFTGRVPFVWVGNQVSNPGANPNLYSPDSLSNPNDIPPTANQTKDNSVLQQSFDLNALVPDFKWPQLWITDIAIDHMFPGNWLITLEAIYGKDINAIYVRNADLVRPVGTLADGRPYYGGAGNNELNPDFGAGVYVMDNTSDGYNYNITVQLRKIFEFGLRANLAYTYSDAQSNLKSTEIASVLFQGNPVQGDPNNPLTSYSEFGLQHRIVGNATYSHKWNENFTSHFGLFFEVSEGNRFAGAGGNRYSFTYSGDVNGDGYSNDLIYIPQNQSEINLAPITDDNGVLIYTPEEQWTALNAFIEQDAYLSQHRGEIAERFGAVNPWWWNIDFRFMQDFDFMTGNMHHTFQLSLDVLNIPSLLSIGGVRKVASSAATSPLTAVLDDATGLVKFDAEGKPLVNFNPNLKETYIDDPSIASRWQIQLGIRYSFSIL
ncbi:MAG: carboxypeptidase regulatory-like domain-containing protein [Ignavibacteriaceae bacterium]